ncbi:hypothetical protein E2C01_095427 [Portunus trituberculatus]|uniref:Uncharacterized protein n=1 Tax=Portunus trituberculatus TaxID=210409 RepID=A0A5B7JSZ7_PORTR|nr:hypothetical protein [Portunus trituberculatus]
MRGTGHSAGGTAERQGQGWWPSRGRGGSRGNTWRTWRIRAAWVWLGGVGQRGPVWRGVVFERLGELLVACVGHFR